MSDLAEKIRKSRRVEIPVGKMKFFGRRATAAEFVKMSRNGSEDTEVVKMLIDGWENVRENDLFPEGSTKKVDFDRELFNEAIEDLPSIWKPIVEALIKSTSEHFKSTAENEKTFTLGWGSLV